LRGTPLRIQMNTAKNPYVDEDKGKKGKKRWFQISF
jgi:GTP-binding protein